MLEPSADGGSGGGGEKVSVCSVSKSSIAERASGCSHGGGHMLTRRCRFKSSASHSGMSLL